jgi:CDP-glycerol glycerophosphotransferase
MKKKLKKLLDMIVKLILNFLFIFIKKSPKIIIFGDFNGKRFGDNSKYLYLYLYKYKYKHYKIIWLTRNKIIKQELNSKGYEAYYINSIKGVYYHIKALYHIVDQGENDINPFLSHNAIKINLWHGYPLKKIMNFCGKVNRTYVGGWEEQYLLTGTEFGEKTIGIAFGIERKKRLNGLFPRVDFLLNGEYPIFDKENEILERIRKMKKEKKKIILYLPTYRDNNKVKFLGTEDEAVRSRFFKFLSDNNYILISKFHPAEKEVIGSYENEVYFNLDSTIDIYPLLRNIDLLITDYSSVYFDFLSLNKEIIFYPYDFKEYITEIRGLLFDYNKITPGYKAFSLESIIEYLKKDIKLRDCYEESRKNLYRICFEDKTIEELIQNILALDKEVK